MSLQHPDTPHVVPYDRSVSTGWLRCDRHLIVGVWQPAYRILSHAAYGRALPEQPLPPAHYAVHITCPGRPLLRIGPYTQCHHADHDAARLRQRLHQPGSVAEAVPFDFDAFNAYHDPHRQNIDDLVVQEPSASPALEP
ncbi:hypothetical protein [Streptomyces sp. RKAG293]|uniref:hypothetical protein n=1 Tax=Streptomyces sp. RKAG293 TaxID=2893403 RepID=UPI002033891A|nr:hypothetical protein [Streptomyces sp. RKAG293]MCM2424184.1 hypothetical protein [Streptomyces sp. RKAG293]